MFLSGRWHQWWHMESVHSHLIVSGVGISKIEDIAQSCQQCKT